MALVYNFSLLGNHVISLKGEITCEAGKDFVLADLKTFNKDFVIGHPYYFFCATNCGLKIVYVNQDGKVYLKPEQHTKINILGASFTFA